FKDVPIIEVFVKPGDAVKAEDPLVTLESDKATMDVPSPAAGTVKQLKVKLGDKVSEGSLLLPLPTPPPPPPPHPPTPTPPLPRRRRTPGPTVLRYTTLFRPFQGRADHRGLRQGGRCRQGRRPTDYARV